MYVTDLFEGGLAAEPMRAGAHHRVALE